MTHKLSFWILVGTAALIGALFFRVVQSLVLPLFVGAVLAILFEPVFTYLTGICRGRQRLAAVLSTALVALTVIGPLALVGTVVVRQAITLVRSARAWLPPAGAEPEESPAAAGDEGLAAAPPGAAAAPKDGSETTLDKLLRTQTARDLLDKLATIGIKETHVRTAVLHLAESTAGLIVPRAYDLIGLMTRFVIDAVMMVIALYFFFADGPKMLNLLDELTPLPPGRGVELFREFETVCRAVVVAMVATALLNGLLCGIGYLLAGSPRVLLLSIVTVVMSFIPFIGLASVWLSVSIYLYMHGQTGAAIAVAVWCGGIVNTLDHFLRPYLIGAQAKLHPLFVLVAVIGGIHLLGFLGIFIGPIVGAVLFALLKILRAELRRLETKEAPAKAE